MDELELIKSIGGMTGASFTITEALKMAGLPSKYASLVAIVIGVGLSFLIGLNPVFGLMAGLTASGTYSSAKKAGETEYTGEK